MESMSIIRNGTEDRHVSYQFYVREDGDVKRLDCMMYQRFRLISRGVTI